MNTAASAAPSADSLPVKSSSTERSHKAEAVLLAAGIKLVRRHPVVALSIATVVGVALLLKRMR